MVANHDDQNGSGTIHDLQDVSVKLISGQTATIKGKMEIHGHLLSEQYEAILLACDEV